MELKEGNQKRKVIVTSSISILGLLLIVGISYAFWQITKYQEDQNVITSGCFDIKLEGGKAINLENAYPIEDTEGAKLTPYTFTITNICDLLASYTVNLEMLEGTTMASKYIKVMMNKEEIKNLGSLEQTEPVLKNSVESRKIISGSLGARDSEEYNLRIWMDGEITIEEKEAMNKQMLSKVVVKAEPKKYSPVESGITLLKDAILATEYQTTDIEEAKEKIARKQEVDFSKTAPIIDWEEVHASSTSTVTATLPDPSLVNSGIAGTENLTDTNVLPLIGTGYTFDEETGYYILTNTQHVDPTTLDLDSQDYYYMGSITQVGSSNLAMLHHSQLTELHKIEEATKNTSTISSLNGTEYDAIAYKMTSYRYTQTEIESDKSDKGLYQINDKDGTSYYYRGSVKNNYVYFGGFYWRIIRINGDGSIRLLYAGTKKDAKDEELLSTLTDSSLGYNNTKRIPFNLKTDNPGYVGYMYGNTLNSSYEETNANENDSEIKKYLDSWYRQNILEKGLSNYIADSGFCNDRSLFSGDGFNPNSLSIYETSNRYNVTKSPTLLCSNRNDVFTVNETKGNGDLTYPIGLITIDELMLSGFIYGYVNRNTFTNSITNYWTMSPSEFRNGSSRIFNPSNGIVIQGYESSRNLGVRPVINLSADTEISSGIGTSNEPFLIN